MMIRRLLSVQRIGLKLSILSLFIFPLILNSEDKDEGLELPEVYIYGTYLGRMQFSPKKDFYPYISQGDLFPPSRPISPEFHVTAHRLLPGKKEKINHYWFLLDAGVGNWWSDKVFLDCGLRNQQGLLSLRFTDFRRKNWTQDHSKTDDFVQLKGAYGQDYYYLSGNLIYSFDKYIGLRDTASSQSGGINLCSKIDMQQIQFSMLSDFSIAQLPNGYRNANGDPTTVYENIHEYSARADYKNTDFGAFARLALEGANKEETSGNTKNSLFRTAADVGVKATFSAFSISPGVSIFIERGKVSASPLVSVNMALEDFGVYPLLSYREMRSINTCMKIYKRNPFDMVDLSEYTILSEKRISGGFKGRWSTFEYFAMYSHHEFSNYPDVARGVPPHVRFVKARKDRIYSSFTVSHNDYKLNASGSYAFNEDVFDEGYPEQDRILYEPVSKVSVGADYGGFKPLKIGMGITSSFAIKTYSEDVDILSLDADVAYELVDNLWFGFAAENIFDQRYEIWPDYTEGGIQFYASLKYKIIK